MANIVEEVLDSLSSSESSAEYSLDYDDVFPQNGTFNPRVSLPAKVIWSMLAGSIMLVAACGNLIVIWIVLANPRMRTVTNYFLLNLAVADSLTSTLSMPFIFSVLLTENFIMGLVMCKLSFFIGNLATCASILSLVFITVDRYRAIIHPFMPRLTKGVVGSMMVIIWTAGSLANVPYLYYQTLIKLGWDNRVQAVCVLAWPDGVVNSETDLW